MFKCTECGGWGEIEIAYSDMTSGYTDDRTVTCERCLGSGRSWGRLPVNKRPTLLGSPLARNGVFKMPRSRLWRVGTHSVAGRWRSSGLHTVLAISRAGSAMAPSRSRVVDLGQRHDEFTDFLKPCDFCGSGFVDLAVSWHCGPVSYQAICDRCYTRGPLCFDMLEAVEKWNTRISFDWLATIAALQMWKDEQRLRREDCEAFEDARSGHALAERLLTEATQTLDRLCGDGEQDAVVRELSGKLNEWLKEAMPF